MADLLVVALVLYSFARIRFTIRVVPSCFTQQALDLECCFAEYWSFKLIPLSCAFVCGVSLGDMVGLRTIEGMRLEWADAMLCWLGLLMLFTIVMNFSITICTKALFITVSGQLSYMTSVKGLYLIRKGFKPVLISNYGILAFTPK